MKFESIIESFKLGRKWLIDYSEIKFVKENGELTIRDSVTEQAYDRMSKEKSPILERVSFRIGVYTRPKVLYKLHKIGKILKIK